MADGREMDANLMRAACLGLGLHQAIVTGCITRLLGKAIQYMVLGDSLPPSGEDRHPLPVLWIASQWRFDPSPARVKVAIQERQIAFFYKTVFELLLQPSAGLFVFSDQDEPRRIAIEAMDNARPVSPLTGQFRAVGQ
jgi:hypothetical protein